MTYTISFITHRLLENRTIKDFYALHDGPFFIGADMQTSEANMRQLLFYGWAKKFLDLQPLSLINEYFGENVAFYFAFFGYYNVALFVNAIVNTIYGLTDFFSSGHSAILVEEVHSKHYLCPTCKKWNMCPFRKMKEKKFETAVSNFIENPYLIYYCLFNTVGAVMFISLWSRYENYLAWLWGVYKEDVSNLPRPEYNVDVSGYQRSSSTGVWVQSFFAKNQLKRRLAVCGMLIAAGLVVMSYWTFLALLKYVVSYQLARITWEEWANYAAMIILELVHTLSIFLFNEIALILAFVITHYENHRLSSSFNASVGIKNFVFTALFTFPTLVFYGFVKGHIFHGPPFARKTWKRFFGVGIMECGPFTCLSEVWTLLIVFVRFQYICIWIMGFMSSSNTDYNIGKEPITKYADYEREYTLLPSPPSKLISKFCFLVIQFSLVLIFAPAFPFTSHLALFFNFFMMRSDAKNLILKHRRPLYTRDYGIGVWRNIIYAVVVISAFTSGFLIAYQTKTLERVIFEKDRHSMNGFLSWSLLKWPASAFTTPTSEEMKHEIDNYWAKLSFNTTLTSCYQYVPGVSQGKNFYSKERERVQEMLATIRKLFVLTYEHMTIFLLMLFNYLIPPYEDDLSDSLSMERRIKLLAKRKKLVNRYKKPDIEEDLDSVPK